MKACDVRLRGVGAVLLGAGLLTFLGCDSGGGEQTPADVDGTWDLYMTVMGTETPMGIMTLYQSGSSVTGTIQGDAVDVTLSGSWITIYDEEVDPTLGLMTLTITGTVSGDHMEGTYTMTVGGVTFTGVWRAERL